MKQKNSMRKRITGARETGVLFALILLFVIFSMSSPFFLTRENILNITRQVSVVSLLSVAMTLVIITGGIDLSVSSVVAFAGIITASGMKDMGLSIPAAILLGLMVGAVTGVVNGILIAVLNMPAFITTMGTMTMLRGLGYIYTGAHPIYDLPKEFKALGQGYIGIIPVPTIIFIIAAIIIHILLSKTVYGRHLYAVGGNPDAARFAGVRVTAVKISVYVISGFVAGIAAVVQAARVGAGMPTIGEGFELEAVAAVVIGGAAMSGGTGTILGTILGSLVLGVLSNGLSLLDVDSYVMQVIRGLVVILAVLIDQIRIMMADRAKVKRTMTQLKEEKSGE